MYRAVSVQHTAIGCFLSLDQPSRSHFQTSSEMRLRTLSGSHWKDCFSDNISVLSALEVYTTMRYINRRFTYLLTYLFTALSVHELSILAATDDCVISCGIIGSCQLAGTVEIVMHCWSHCSALAKCPGRLTKFSLSLIHLRNVQLHGPEITTDRE